MTRKKIIILAVILLVATTASIVYLKIQKKTTINNSQIQTDNPISSFRNGLNYNSSTREITKFNPATQSYDTIAKTKDINPSYVEISPDGKNLILSTNPNSDGEILSVDPDFANLTVRPVNDERASIVAESIFSPHFLDKKNIIYQDLSASGEGDLVVRSIESGKALKNIAIGEDGPSDIHVLDASHIIASQYSSDIGDINAKFVDLSSGEYSGYLSGKGLIFKTLSGSPYLAYQTLEASGISSNLINWKTKQSLKTSTEPIGNLTWSQDGSQIFSAKDTTVLQEGTDGQRSTFKQLTGEKIISLDLLENRWLSVTSIGDNQIFDTNI